MEKPLEVFVTLKVFRLNLVFKNINLKKKLKGLLGAINKLKLKGRFIILGRYDK